MASLDVQGIQCGQKCRVRRVVRTCGVAFLPPGALFGGDFIQEIFTTEARDRQELHLLLDDIAALLQVWLELAYTFFVTFTGPFDRGIIHLVDDDDQVLHTEGLAEQGVFAGLATLLETSLKFTLARRNHKDTDIGLGGTRNLRADTQKKGDYNETNCKSMHANYTMLGT